MSSQVENKDVNNNALTTADKVVQTAVVILLVVFACWMTCSGVDFTNLHEL